MWETDFLIYIVDNFQNSIMTDIMLVITTLGNYGAVWLAIDAVLLINKRIRSIGIAVALSMFITFVSVNIVLKPLIDRARPFEVSQHLFECMLIALPSDGSFPSGHTAIAFASSVAVLCFSKRLGIPLVVFSVLMGLSRIYFAVHFPTDVLGGMLIGTMAALVSVFVFTKYFPKYEKNA